METAHSIAVDKVFVALADDTRRALLAHLAEQGGASASALASRWSISRQAIAKHLVLLESAGLVSKCRQGREVMYEAQPHQLAATGRWMQRIAQRWSQTCPP